MGIMDKLTAGLSAGAERAAKEAGKAFDKGKAKVGELQIEMQMDGLAKKLGYHVFDLHRGREVDQTEQQRLLDDLSGLEDQLHEARAEAAAKAQAEAVAKAQARAAKARAGSAPAGAAGEPAPGAPGAAGPSDDEQMTPPTPS